MSTLNTSANIEQIRESHEYNEIVSILASYQTQIGKILDSNKWKLPSGYFTAIMSQWLYSKLDTIDLESVRTLKQALNNYFCTAVFQSFKNQADWIESWSLITLRGGKLEKVKVEEFFYNSIHPFLLTYILEISSFLNFLKIPVWKMIPQKYKANIINYYFNVWRFIVKNIFLQILQDVIYGSEEHKKLFWEYLALESYTLRKIPVNETQGFCSIIDYVLLNNSMTYLKKYLFEELKWNTDIEKITRFLKKQAEYEIILSSSLKAADVGNFFEHSWWKSKGMIFSEKEWCYIINTSEVNRNSTHLSEYAWLKRLQWCPFARTKLLNEENAFMAMFEILDKYFLVILEELKRKGF